MVTNRRGRGGGGLLPGLCLRVSNKGGDHGSYSFCAWYLTPTSDTDRAREMRIYFSVLASRSRERRGVRLVGITRRRRIVRRDRPNPGMGLDVGDVQPKFSRG